MTNSFFVTFWKHNSKKGKGNRNVREVLTTHRPQNCGFHLFLQQHSATGRQWQRENLQYKHIKTKRTDCKSVPEQTLESEGAQELTPRHHVIDMHLVFDVVNFNNKQVKVDSLDEHPTESCNQKVLHKSCYSNTGTL